MFVYFEVNGIEFCECDSCGLSSDDEYEMSDSGFCSNCGTWGGSDERDA